MTFGTALYSSNKEGKTVTYSLVGIRVRQVMKGHATNLHGQRIEIKKSFIRLYAFYQEVILHILYHYDYKSTTGKMLGKVQWHKIMFDIH